MLVSKIKPCTSKYNPDIIRETADGSLDQLWFIGVRKNAMDNCGNSRANTCNQALTLRGKRAFIRNKASPEGSPFGLRW